MDLESPGGKLSLCKDLERVKLDKKENSLAHRIKNSGESKRSHLLLIIPLYVLSMQRTEETEKEKTAPVMEGIFKID